MKGVIVDGVDFVYVWILLDQVGNLGVVNIDDVIQSQGFIFQFCNIFLVFVFGCFVVCWIVDGVVENCGVGVGWIMFFIVWNVLCLIMCGWVCVFLQVRIGVKQVLVFFRSLYYLFWVCCLNSVLNLVLFCFQFLLFQLVGKVCVLILVFLQNSVQNFGFSGLSEIWCLLVYL